ncbi:MAG: hypothetical protein O3B95_12705 [Chloroflexi bacterium]|nr:hypothetical protein [Chloroflexota bacterium]
MNRRHLRVSLLIAEPMYHPGKKGKLDGPNEWPTELAGRLYPLYSDFSDKARWFSIDYAEFAIGSTHAGRSSPASSGQQKRRR